MFMKSLQMKKMLTMKTQFLYEPDTIDELNGDQNDKSDDSTHHSKILNNLGDFGKTI